MEIKLKLGLILLIIGLVLIGTYLALNVNCHIKCKFFGYNRGFCRTTPLNEPNMPTCESGETNISKTLACNSRGLIGVAVNCCCK